MATDAQVQAECDTTGLGIRIIRSVESAGGTLISRYVTGGDGRGARARWIDTTVADTAAAQATTIKNDLLNP